MSMMVFGIGLALMYIAGVGSACLMGAIHRHYWEGILVDR